MKHIKLGLYILFISFIVGCMNVTRLSSAEMMNTRFPAEHFFVNERAEMGQAIYDNNLAKVKSLIAQGHNVNAQPEGNQSFTYLMYAVFLRNRFEIMQALLGAGADPNQLSIVYFPPYQSKYIVQPNIKGTEYFLPLSLASGNSDIRYMEALLKHGADPNAGVSTAGAALFAAVRNVYAKKGWDYARRIEEIKLRIDLLLQYGANINQPDQFGQNIINVATSHPDIVLYLMDKGIDPKLYGEKLAKSMTRLLDANQTEKRAMILRRLEKMGYRYSE